jgi:serine/threonine protein kinase
MEKLEGTRLGAYEIVERIGGGGMAEVYIAKQKTAFDREVAIKVIRKGYAEDEDFRARFLREARVISHLSHPHILPLIEFGEGGEKGEILFLVMPHVAGGTLSNRIKAHGGPLPFQETARIFSQLCEAVDYAHQHKLVHRDIKPSNVLVQDSRNILLADFGIALDQGDPRLTVTGMGLGTAEYMAPEQARGQADNRSDIYSLGVVLYTMLSGHVPYTGSTPFDVLLKHASEPIPPLSRFNTTMPPQIEQVLQKAMSKLPDDRFQTAQELLNAFEEAQVQAGIHTGSSSMIPGVQPGNLITSRDSSQPSLGSSAPATPASLAGSSGPHTPPTTTRGSGPHSGPTSISDEVPTIRASIVDSSQDDQLQTLPISSPRIQPGNPSAPLPSGVVTPPSRSPAGGRKKLIAAIVALVILLVGSTATGAIVFLHQGSQPSPATATRAPTSAATPKPASLTFTAGTPCSQAATHPKGPASGPLLYRAPTLIDHGRGAPAYAAVDNVGTLYYTDQAHPGIYGLSAALTPHNNHLIWPTLGTPSGIAITPDAASQVYYLFQNTASSTANEQVGVFNQNSSNPTLLGGLSGSKAGGGNGFALALNPTNKAVLMPTGTTGVVYCLGKGSTQPQSIITGLKDPVAAIVDSSGNIYVADLGGNEILRFPPKGTGPDWHQSFTAPVDLVLDSQGYLLATLQGTGIGNGSVVRIDPTTGQQLDTLMSGLQQPRGLAYDTSEYRSGTVYVIDQKGNKIYALCQSQNGICT